MGQYQATSDTEGHRVTPYQTNTPVRLRGVPAYIQIPTFTSAEEGGVRGVPMDLYGNETPPVGDFLVRVWKVGGEEATLHQPLHGGGLWYRCTSQVYFTYILKYNPSFA